MPTKLVDLLVKGNTFTANIGLNAGPAFQFVKQCGVSIYSIYNSGIRKGCWPSRAKKIHGISRRNFWCMWAVGQLTRIAGLFQPLPLDE